MIRVLPAWFFLLLTTQFVIADDEVLADIAISVQQSGDIWRGQQVTLNLDLKTTGYSFSNTHFNLPEVSGAFLMQTDTTTIKFSENLNGVNWQVIRYPLALYPQTAGQLEVPAIEVRFNTSAGFGSVETTFEFQTAPLQVQIQSPPGVKQNELVVSTTSFEFDYEWYPESGTAHTGDAITLTVNRRASDISAMLLPPLPAVNLEGLATYPQAPVVNDKTDRGDLTGERTDSIIWLIENPGNYDIPGIRFQWWDPGSHELKQQIIPGIKLDVPSSTTDLSSTDAARNAGRATPDLLWLLVVLALASLGFFLWPGIKRRSSGQAVESEKSTFRTLERACKSDQISQAYTALHSWLTWVSPDMTLGEFADECNDSQLNAELQRLQEELISTQCNWQGTNFLRALRRIRKVIAQKKEILLKAQLAPLNP